MDRHKKQRRQRQLLDNSIDMQQPQMTTNFKDSYSDSDFDFDEYYRNYHRSRKEYCLVKIIYRKSSDEQQRQRRLDEIVVMQNHRMVFKGCLCKGDEFTFKCQYYKNQPKIKLKFYINDLFDDEIISCCAYGLINRNRSKHLFHIEQVIGAKPCYDCEFNENLLKTTNTIDRQDSKIDSRRSCELDNSPINVANKSSTDEIKQNSTLQRQKTESGNEKVDITSPIPSRTRRTYGPPQLSNLLSMVETIDQPFENVRTSSTNVPSSDLINSAVAFSRAQSIEPSTYHSTQLSTIETNQNDTQTSTSMDISNQIPMANEIIQLLLSQLGITRQQQTEHVAPANRSSSREKGNVEHFILIYLHETNPDESIIQHLRSLVNFVKIFNDIDDCVAFINTVVAQELILIVSDAFHQTISLRIENIVQILNIYTLSDNIEQNTSNIKHFYTDINEIYKQIVIDIEKTLNDLVIYLSISSTATNIKSSDVYHLLLNEILLEENDNKNYLKNFISFARQEYEGNTYELNLIDEFERTYKKTDAIYWYTRGCFLSKMLNKAFCVPSPDILYYFQFFIRDLSQQISIESSDDIRFVYIGQTIAQTDLDDLQTNIQGNDIIALPQFLLASTNREYAIEIANHLLLRSNDRIPFLMSLEIPEEFQCANIKSRRYKIDENNNVLLNFNCMYRLIKIEKHNSISTIYLRLIKPDEQPAIENYLETTRKTLNDVTTFVSLIKLMILNNEHASAERFVQISFNDDLNKSDDNWQGSIAVSANQLAIARRNQQNYQLALENFLLCLNAFERIVPVNSPDLSVVHSNIGAMYFRLQNFNQSSEHYTKALQLQLRAMTPDVIAISVYTRSLGTIHARLGNTNAAINSFLRAIRVLQQHPETHVDTLLEIYDELGDIYYFENKFDEAVESYIKAIEYQEQVVPRDIQSLGRSYHAVGNLLLKLARSKDALKYLKQALEYFQQVLPSTHASFVLLNNNIGLMHYRQEQCDEALEHYNKALELAAVALPENHSLVGIVLFNMALLYMSREEYDQAIEYVEKSTKQFLKTLPEDHSDVLENQKYLETIRQKKMLKEIFDNNTTNF